MATPPRSQFTDALIDVHGETVTSCRVTVYLAPPYAAAPLTTPAVLFNAESGAATPGNPFLPSSGIVSVWAAPGSYDVKIEDTAVPAKLATRVVRWDAVPGDKGLISAQVGDDQITTPTIAPGAVGATEIADGSVGSAELAASAVTTAKILDGSVTTPKLADGSVTAVKLEAQQAWQTIALTGFVSPGLLSYYKDSLGIVHFQGNVIRASLGSPPTAGATLCAMPAGYRPGATIVLPIGVEVVPPVVEVRGGGPVMVS